MRKNRGIHLFVLLFILLLPLFGTNFNNSSAYSEGARQITPVVPVVPVQPVPGIPGIPTVPLFPTPDASPSRGIDLIDRRSHEKPAKTQYWQGLYRDRVAFKFVDGLIVNMQSGPDGKPSFVVTDIDTSRSGVKRLNTASIQSQVLALNRSLQNAPVTGIRPYFSQDASVLRNQRATAERRTGKEHAYLENYFWTYLEPRSLGENVADLLNRLDIVEIAYLPPISQNADIPPATQDFKSSQGYLNPATQNGIDARFAWGKPGGRGLDVRFVDIEAGWNLDHEDLKPPFFTFSLFEINAPGFDFNGDGDPDNSHGTAVLGELIGRNDGHGVTGIAGDAEYAVVSTIRAAALLGSGGGASGIHDVTVADSVNTASGLISEGDVIIIEQHSPGPSTGTVCTCNCDQFEFVPMEFFPASFDAIQTATSNGKVVVEAAGNGSMNLDSPIYGNRFNRNFRDSGAILVGASRSTSRNPACFSNFGSRVDIHAWGENVMTTGYGDVRAFGEDQRQFYTRGFSGTSSATPIVSGAAISMQGMLKAVNQDALLSQEMRSLLSSTGTPQVSPVSKAIGPMPDLRRAFNQQLGGQTVAAGGPGGNEFLLRCDQGQVLAGAKGRAGWFINQIKAICATGAGVFTETAPVGGTGGTPFTTMCDDGFAVTGFTGFADFYIDSFRFECKQLQNNAPTGNIRLSLPAGGDGGTAFRPLRCGPNQVAVGIRGRAADFVDSVQLVCEQVVLDQTQPTSWVSPAAGGIGGNSFRLGCASNEVLIGVNAKAGFWIDSIAPICIGASNNGSWAGNPRRLNTAGGSGGSSVTLICPNNTAVSGISGRSSMFVDKLVIRCRPLASTNATQGNSSTLSVIGGSGGEAFGPYNCPGNLPGTGFQGRAKDYLDRIQLICGRP